MIGLLLIGLAIVMVALIGHTVYSLTHPPRRTYASAVARSRAGDPSEIPPAEGGPRAFESWTFESRDNALPVWDMRGDDPHGPVMIVTHGWGDSRIGSLSRASALAPLASRLVLWDMPGHGDAPGTSTLAAREPSDLVALIDRLEGTASIVLVGWSMGAAVSLVAANARAERVIGVIAESPYRLPETPARNALIASYLPYRVNLPVAMWLVGVEVGAGPRWNRPEPFDRARWAAGLKCPLLVIHGGEDRISPLGDGRTIAEAAERGRLLVVDGAGHDGIWTNPASRHLCTQAATELVREAKASTIAQ